MTLYHHHHHHTYHVQSTKAVAAPKAVGNGSRQLILIQPSAGHGRRTGEAQHQDQHTTLAPYDPMTVYNAM